MGPEVRLLAPGEYSIVYTRARLVNISSAASRTKLKVSTKPFLVSLIRGNRGKIVSPSNDGTLTTLKGP